MRNFVLQNFPFLENDFDAMTDYELFCKMVEYMKESLKKISDYQIELNGFAQKLSEFQNYFDNLDLQEEVDNKLDEMYENGQLTELIEQFIQLQTTFTFNDVAEMIASENLVNGSYARSLHYYDGDLGGASYKIRNILNTDVIDGMLIIAMENPELVAELVTDNTINVEQLGITNDNANLVFEKAINNFDVINVNSDIELIDSIELSNLNNKIINGNNHIISISHEYSKNLMELNDVHNFTFNNLILQNDDTYRTGSTAPLELFLIYGDSVDDLKFNECKFINPYHNGVDFIKSSYLYFNKCLFKDVYYSGLTLLPECHDVIVDECIFDSAHTTYENAYLFSTGSFDYVTEYDYLVNNVIVKNSKFLNNPQWEGIDFHGGSNITIENNYVYDCKEGIHCVYDTRPTVVSEYVDNIKIINNTVINKNIETTNDGIVLTGSPNKYGTNYIVTNNIVDGYGTGTNKHAINVGYCKHGTISNNNITNIKVRGIGLSYSYNVEVCNNKLNNPLSSTTAGIYTNVAWLCDVHNNSIIGSDDYQFQRCITTSNNKGLLNLRDNFCINYSQYKYYSGTNNSTIIGTVGTSSKRCGVIGIKSVDEYDNLKSYCSDTVVRGVATTSGLTVTGNVNDKILECNSSLANICPYQEIVITGAGEGGADLTTQITDVISQTKIKIKDSILTAVTGATVSTTASTWINY